MKGLAVCILAVLALGSWACAQQTMTIDLAANDIIYSPFTGKIYASVPSFFPGRGNTITVIDPETGAIGSSVFVGSEPWMLALSDDGQYLYVDLDGQGAIRRYDCASETAGPLFYLGSDPFTGVYYTEDLEVLPGHPESIAVSRFNKSGSPRHEGVAIYDNGVQRTNTTPRHTGANRIEFSASADRLYGHCNESSLAWFYRLNVDASGVTVLDESGGLLQAFDDDIEFDNGLIYTMRGQAIDPEARVLLGTYAVGYSLVEPDSALGLTFFLTEAGTTMRLMAFNQTTFVPVWWFDVPDVSTSDWFWTLIRWGSDGLAFCMSGDIGDKIYLVRTGLGPPSPPSNLVATALSSTQIRLTWDDNSSDETGFEIERKSGAGAFSTITTTPGDTTEFTDTPLAPNTMYYYRVRAIGQNGHSAYSNETSAKTCVFSDVGGADSYRPYEEALYRVGIAGGCFYDPATGERRYCPLASVSRAEMAKFLCAAAGKAVLNRDTPTFADVPATHWAYGFVERLADAASWGGSPPTGGCRVVGGVRYYCPSDLVTREQMAKFLCVATSRSPTPSCSGTFGDVPSGSAFCTYVERLTDGPSWPGGVAVTSGCAAGPPKLYCPKANITRAQMAVFLVRAFGITL